MPTVEASGLWRAENAATLDQINKAADQLVVPEHIIAEVPVTYRIPPTEDYAFRTLSIISNILGGVARQQPHPLSLISAGIQEQTHRTLERARALGEPFYARRTVFDIGLEVEEGPGGKIPADDFYLKLAHYDTAVLRELEGEVGRRFLVFDRAREAGQDLSALNEAYVALRASRTAYLRRSLHLQSRAAYGDVTSDDAEILLAALRGRGKPLSSMRRQFSEHTILTKHTHSANV